MKTLKLTLAVTIIAASAFVVANAAEALRSPSTAANATAPVAPRTVVGSPRGLASLPGTTPPAATSDATAHCKNPKKGQTRMSCCN